MCKCLKFRFTATVADLWKKVEAGDRENKALKELLEELRRLHLGKVLELSYL